MNMPSEHGTGLDAAVSAPVHGKLANLAKLMAPPAGGGDVVDWPVLGTQGISLPSDYREFVAVYGEGDIDRIFDIDTPAPLDRLVREQSTADPATDRAAYLSAVQLSAGLEKWRPWEQVYKDDEGQSHTVDVVVFGSGLDGEAVFWECCSADPDDWTVIMFKRQHSFNESGWRRYDFGMVDFLTAVLDGSVRDAFSAANFPGSPPVFTHRRSYPYSGG